MTTILPGFPLLRSGKVKPISHQSRSQQPDAKTGSWILADDTLNGPHDLDNAELEDLNSSLHLLVEVFPDVQAEVFRELLSNLSKESRNEIITENLLKDKGRWVKGRYRTTTNEVKDRVPLPGGRNVITDRREGFRNPVYQQAVKAAMYLEFKGISHAAIKAVLAEHNYSYTASRPALYRLSTKSWRYYFSSLWSKKTEVGTRPAENPLVMWQSPASQGGVCVPFLRHTGSNELDQELYETIIAPGLTASIQTQSDGDQALAKKLNEEEALEHIALFECECCYTSYPFEDMASCQINAHMVCASCIRFTMNEALFGQGWAKTVDVKQVTLTCLSSDGCESILFTAHCKQAIINAPDGERLWLRFEDQITRQQVDNCGLPMLRCPFCTYAEVDTVPVLVAKDLSHFTEHTMRLVSIAAQSSISQGGNFILACLLFVLHPLLCTFLIVLQKVSPSSFSRAHMRVLQLRRGLSFRCQSPRCLMVSCSVCYARWTDPHICYETTTNSLRHAIEAATTAVVKRTCPRCNTSFVKSTGCNKLVCPCGYAMCYICRGAIGSEGYTHFCQHFRDRGGRCRECERCDLYAVENEEVIIRKAADLAEITWREKQGLSAGREAGDQAWNRGAKLNDVVAEVISGPKKTQSWTWDGALDMFLEVMLATSTSGDS